MKDVTGLAVDLTACSEDGKMEVIVVKAPGIEPLLTTISVCLALGFRTFQWPG